MLISQLLKATQRPAIFLLGTATLRQAAQLMASEAIGAVVIAGPGGGLQGLLAERDVVRAIACGGAAVACDATAKWMRSNVPTVTPDTQVRDAVALITARRARHLPVLDAGRVVGVLSVGDLLISRLSETTQENLVLREVALWPRPQVA